MNVNNFLGHNLDNQSINRLRDIPLDHLWVRELDGVYKVKKRNCFGRFLRWIGIRSRTEDQRMAQLFRNLDTLWTVTVDPGVKERIENIFINKMRQLRVSPFSKDHKLSKIFQNALYQKLVIEGQIQPETPGANLEQLRANKQDTEEHKLERRFEKAKLANALGFGIKGAKGYHGTSILTDIQGTPMCVFKPRHDGWKYKFYSHIPFSQMYYLHPDTTLRLRSEEVAFQVYRIFHFDLRVPELIPISQEKALNERPGVAQLFIKNFDGLPPQEMTQVEKNRELRFDDTQDPDNLTQLQLAFIHDYLIGNLDMHSDNWFVFLRNENGEQKIRGIRAIDKANSNPIRHPKNRFYAPKHQFCWVNRAYSAQSFTNETIQFVLDNFNRANLDNYLNLFPINEPDNPNHHYHVNIRDRITERFEAIRYFVLERQNGTPQMLGNTFRDEELLNRSYQI